MSLSYTTVDVFTTSKFAGNPLAIVHVPSSVILTQEKKQDIANEFNLSETVFVHEPRPGDEPNSWTIDIFTIGSELPLAGHPVIGTACHLLGSLAGDASCIVKSAFTTKGGHVGLEYDARTQRAFASLPHNVRVHAARYSAAALAKHQPQLPAPLPPAPVVSIVKGMTFVLVELPSLAALAAVAKLSEQTVARRDEGWDVGLVGAFFYTFTDAGDVASGSVKLRTRMMQADVGEDPATGSASCALASYLALEHGRAGQRVDFELTQGVEMGRKSDVLVQVQLGPDKELKEVRLGGGAVTIMEGKLFI